MGPRPVESAAVEAELQEVGRGLARSFPSVRRHPVRAIDERAMRAATRDRELRAALFRLVDVTPACRSLDELAAHLSGFAAEVHDPPHSLEIAMRMSESRAGRAALGAAVAAGVRHMAQRFVVGETPSAALPILSELWHRGQAVSVDLLGEATVTAGEADSYAASCVAALETLAAAARGWPGRAGLESDTAGPMPRANLSVKVSALTPHLHPEAPEIGSRDAADRLRPLLRRARDLGAHLHLDMESYDLLETTTDLFYELLEEEEFRRGPSTGLVVQAYLRDSPAHLERLLDWAARTRRSQPPVVRLVKGAYWDHEVVEARQHGWTPPVLEDKAACDRNFEALTRRLLDAGPVARPAIASHNLRSISHAIAYSRMVGRPDGDLELQVLRGLGDDLAEALASGGFRVRVYCPVGDLVAGMAYLVRRLLENTSNESFLTARSEGASLEQLLSP